MMKTNKIFKKQRIKLMKSKLQKIQKIKNKIIWIIKQKQR